jgi:hypothetical protein
MYKIASSLQQQNAIRNRVGKFVRNLEQHCYSQGEIGVGTSQYEQSPFHPEFTPHRQFTAETQQFTFSERREHVPRPQSVAELCQSCVASSRGNSQEFATRCGIFPPPSSHLGKLKRGGGGGLTCLSARCLSSYLIFPPVPVSTKRGRSSRSKQ